MGREGEGSSRGDRFRRRSAGTVFGVASLYVSSSERAPARQAGRGWWRFTAILAAVAIIAASCGLTDQEKEAALESFEDEGFGIGSDNPAEGSGGDEGDDDEAGDDDGADGDPEDGSAGADGVEEPSPEPGDEPDEGDIPAEPTLVGIPDLGECAGEEWINNQAGLNPNGAAVLPPEEIATLAHYRLAVAVDPESGDLAGRMVAELPPVDGDYDLRLFAGLSEFGIDVRVGDATIDGEPVELEVDDALIRIRAEDVGGDADDRHEVMLEWSYTMPEINLDSDPFGALSGESLNPADVGLLGRYPGGAQLGHWSPVLLAPEARNDADPDGFGDIGAFPAAAICAVIDINGDYEVVTGGTRLDTAASEFGDDRTAVTEAGVGLRDLGVVVRNDIAQTSLQVDEVSVNVWHPVDTDLVEVASVVEESAVSVEVLSEAFGPYPWTDLDVLATPLGSGVGGMEWPGAIWIESSIFEGGLPGLGGLGGLLDDVLNEDSGLGLTLRDTREWTIAHEVGHEWWHAVVGNDSVASPSVDEPLAQFSACVVFRNNYPDNWEQRCAGQTTANYAQSRALGVEDAPADQASDDFDNALQYGAVVYGKAPGFYLAAAELMGWDELVGALREFVAENNFDLVETGSLRSHLAEAAAAEGIEPEVMEELWDRWFSGTFGDEDIDISAAGGLGGLGDLGGLGEVSPEQIEESQRILEDILNEDGSIEDLLGDLDPDDLNIDDLNLDDLLEPDSDSGN